MSIHLVKAEMFYADRRTDRHNEANSCFFAVLWKSLNLKKLSGITASRSQSSKEYPCSQEVKNNFASPVHLNGRLPYSFTQGKESVQSRQKLSIFILNMERWANFKGWTTSKFIRT